MSGEAARPWGRWAATLSLGLFGALVANVIGAPLPWLLGAMAATGIAAARGVRFAGGPPSFPPQLRLVMIPVIGVLIGGAFRPETIDQMADWWPGLVSMLLFVPLAHFVNYRVLTSLCGFSRSTSFFGGMPGGLIEAIELGGEHGADVRSIALLQFARIAVVVTAVPLIYSLAQGEAVGSAAGVALSGGAPLTGDDVILLVGAGGIGFMIARFFHWPAGQITGPIFVSAIVHGGGWTEAAPPAELVSVAQLFIGVHLGCRFAGADPALLARCFRGSTLTVASMLGIGALFSAALSAAGVEAFGVLVLCYAPGGVVEMGLIALSLNASPIFVTAHHVVRIIATVFVGGVAWKRLGIEDDPPACQRAGAGE